MTVCEVEAKPYRRAAIVNGFRVLVIEDDADFRGSLAELVQREGFTVSEAASLEEARTQLADAPDIVFLDLMLPDGSGLDALTREEGPRPDFVVVTGNATIEAAGEALRRGALDFLTKPLDRGRLRAILAHFVRTHDLRNKLSVLRGELRHLGRFGLMVGRSGPMQQVYELIGKVAPTRASVLITGESGTGKELVAETIHQMSARASRPFLAVNCGAVAPNVIESELFGHERGSFTGAERFRKGYFEEANGGTLLLDEVTEMTADLQVKLLRVIDTGRLIRVGASEPIAVDVRVIAATNRDPQAAIRQGRMREDLYYRLNVFQIPVPPLRERGTDVLMLAEHFLNELNAREGSSKRWSERALRKLEGYAWPGNVRELRNVVERAAILSGEVIDDPGLPEGSLRPASAGDGTELVVRVGSPLAEVERTMILATLRLVRGDKREAARRLGISLKTLYNRLIVYKAAGRMETVENPGT
jgi:DNA-binding NtrC family response regulator